MKRLLFMGKIIVALDGRVRIEDIIDFIRWKWDKTAEYKISSSDIFEYGERGEIEECFDGEHHKGFFDIGNIVFNYINRTY